MRKVVIVFIAAVLILGCEAGCSDDKLYNIDSTDIGITKEERGAVDEVVPTEYIEYSNSQMPDMYFETIEERYICDVILCFLEEVFDVDEECDVTHLFLDETNPYIEFCREKNKLYFGIGKVYDNPISTVTIQLKEDTIETTENAEGEICVNAEFVLGEVYANEPDVTGYAVFPVTFVFSNASEDCKIISVTSDDYWDRILSYTTAEEHLQKLRESSGNQQNGY